MTRSRLAALPLLFALTLLPFAARGADLAVSWPGKDVHLTIPFTAGNESGLYYSLLKEAFAAKTGWKLLLRNFWAEAGGQAWARMADDEPDGYALTGVNVPHVFLRGLKADSGVKPAALRVCVLLNHTPCVLWSPTPDPAALKNFIDAARKKPGGPLAAGPGRFSSAQLAARMLDRAAGVRSTYLPYAGTSEAAKAAKEGKAALFWAHSVTLPAFAGARPLAVAAEKRHPALPGVPTFRELGYDVVQGTYRGIAVPAGVPEETCAGIAAVFKGLAADPAIRAKAVSLGFTPVDLPYERLAVFVAARAEECRALYEDYALGKQD